jgi:hypothetical protein
MVSVKEWLQSFCFLKLILYRYAVELVMDANSFGPTPAAAMNALKGASCKRGSRGELLDRAAIVWSLNPSVGLYTSNPSRPIA